MGLPCGASKSLRSVQFSRFCSLKAALLCGYPPPLVEICVLEAPLMIWHCSAHAAVRVDDFYGRLSAVSGAAAHSQVHPPLVRRRPRRVDHLHVVFPGVAAGGLRLRLPDLPLAQTPCPGYRPPGAAGIGAGSPARHTFGCLETNRRRKPGAPDSGLARSEEHTSELQSRQYLVC